MKKYLFLCCFVSFGIELQAQSVGDKNIREMNDALVKYSAVLSAPLVYKSDYGIVEQDMHIYIEHYKISDIKKIIVLPKTNMYEVQLLCDEKDPCINQIKLEEVGKNFPSANYFFTDPAIANIFATKAAEIIKNDFKGKVELVLLQSAMPAHVSTDINAPIIKEETTKPSLPASDKGKNFLKIDSDDDEPGVGDRKGGIARDDDEDDLDDLRTQSDHQRKDKPKREKIEKYDNTPAIDIDDSDAGNGMDQANSLFGKRLFALLQSINSDKLESVKGAQKESVFDSKIKLPKAKRNYISKYKNGNCFIAEFGTAENPGDLEELFNDIRASLEDELNNNWDAQDRSQDNLYDNVNFDVYHNEWVNDEENKPYSITLMIAPDGKKFTLFLRLGNR